MVTRECQFAIYSIEQYKTAKHIGGREVVQLFRKYALFDYFNRFYESLHTLSSAAIVEEIDEVIKMN